MVFSLIIVIEQEGEWGHDGQKISLVDGLDESIDGLIN
jgi:hypothetical protein